ncbi:MAG TPA: DUF2127 domain-containing protein [Solirubrobacteraceae bacterium]
MNELPGTAPPRRFVPRLHWELIVCGLRGHRLVGTDAEQLRPDDEVFAFAHEGARWHRCLRCDSWLPLPAPAHPSRPAPPDRDEIDLPLRGRPLRDRIVLRLIAIDRALHFLVLGLLGWATLLFASHRAQLRDTFYRVVSAIQGGVGGGPIDTHRTGILHDLDRLFTLDAGKLRLFGAVVLVYAAVEGVEAVGLWFEKRWAEYLTLIVTASLLPLEVVEMLHHFTPTKVVAFVINVAVVVYLLLAKRLFGLRGGARALEAARARDVGWAALERSGPPGPRVAPE